MNEGNNGEFAFEGLYGIAPNYRFFTDYVERIEVLKGPSAALSGIALNGGVGGVINIVPKRAGEDLTRLSASYGSVVRFGGYYDVARRYGDNREWGVRANGSLRSGDTPIDRQSETTAVGRWPWTIQPSGTGPGSTSSRRPIILSLRSVPSL